MTVQINQAALEAPLPPPSERAVAPWDKGKRSKTIRVFSPKGPRAWTASSLADNDIPWTAVEAYKRAAVILAEVDPGCQIPWTLLAAIGRVESNHGQYAGATLGTDGVSRPQIIGVALNGVGPVAIIPDTDQGAFDQDKRWDHAVGPMQFIPTTWAVAGVDGDGDGVRSPNDIDDAALASAVYLCAGRDESILEPASMRAAIYHYNYSRSYVSLVMAIESSYRSGDFDVSTAPPPAAVAALSYGAGLPAQVETSVVHAAHKADRHPPGTSPLPTSTPKDGPARSPQPTVPRTPSPEPDPDDNSGHGPATDPDDNSGPNPGPSPKPDPEPDVTPKPKPEPDVTPKPEPDVTPKPGPEPDPATGPVLVSVSGTWSSCGVTFCLTAEPLDLGAVDLSAPAADDFDGDTVVETNGEEFTGLGGVTVTLMVEETETGRVVYVINAKDYRLADGTFAQPPSAGPPA